MTEKKSSASFKEQSNIVHICAHKVIQADFEHMENDVRRNDTELREIGEESDVLIHSLTIARKRDRRCTFNRMSVNSLTMVFFL